MRSGGRRAATLALAALVAMGPALTGQVGQADEERREDTFLDGTERLEPYRGDLHAHTSYSDGEDTPEDAFADARAQPWLDFFTITDHAAWLGFPFKADSDCIGPQAVDCYSSPLPERTEWEETGHHAQRFTGEHFLAMRGFEWSSFVEGHVNVYNTRIWTDSIQTGQAPMTGLYAWLQGEALDPDRYATFNHPGREPLRFDNFSYEPRMDPFFVSLEVFNRDDDYTDHYTDALDEGWHLGAHGVTDGHGTDDRVDRSDGHTVVLADALTKPGLRRALQNHHTVGTQGSDQDARLRVDGHLMGDTVPDPGESVRVSIELFDADKVDATAFEKVELLGPQGFQRTLGFGEEQACQQDHDGDEARVECHATVAVDDLPTTALDESYLTVRAHQVYEGEVRGTVMTSAVWLAG